MKKTVKIFLFFLVLFLLTDLFLDKADSRKKELILSNDRQNETMSRVLGEVDKKNAFPISNVYASGFIPIRKNDYYDLKIWAGSSVAVDAESGTILHYDNGKKRTQIASLTKIMTAVLVVENIKNLEKEEVIIPKGIAYMPGTVVGCPRTGYCLSNRLFVGEKVSALNLMKAMLMNSANDAAYSLAFHIAGSEKKFVEMMNEKARNLGLKDTNFCTASGLETDGEEYKCYSSAYDIARIAVEALNHDIIWEIMKIPEDRFYSTNGKYMHELKNTDILLEELPNCVGGKTGFTPLAGKSLLFVSQDNTKQHRVAMVILNDPNRWQDMRILNSWVFDNYEWR